MERFINKMFLGDCLELMRDLPSASVDMILCDLPYGTTACKWDTVIPFADLWEQYERIIKPGAAIVLTASQPFTSALVMSNPKLFKHEWIWKKNFGSNFANLKYAPFKEHESILIFGKGRVNYFPIREERNSDRYKYKYNGKGGGDFIGGKLETDKAERLELRLPSSVQKFNCERGLHPTQKPVSLFSYLIRTYTEPGAIVLDNCSGSGTTAAAAIKEGRRFVCMEKDPDIYKVGKDRIDALLSVPTLAL